MQRLVMSLLIGLPMITPDFVVCAGRLLQSLTTEAL
jgi:hypothetical protein